MGVDNYCDLYLIDAAYFMEGENIVKYFIFKPSQH